MTIRRCLRFSCIGATNVTSILSNRMMIGVKTREAPGVDRELLERMTGIEPAASTLTKLFGPLWRVGPAMPTARLHRHKGPPPGCPARLPPRTPRLAYCAGTHVNSHPARGLSQPETLIALSRPMIGSLPCTLFQFATPLRFAPARFAPARFALFRSAPPRFEAVRFALARSTSVKVAPNRLVPFRSAPDRSHPVKIAFGRFPPATASEQSFRFERVAELKVLIPMLLWILRGSAFNVPHSSRLTTHQQHRPSKHAPVESDLRPTDVTNRSTATQQLMATRIKAICPPPTPRYSHITNKTIGIISNPHIYIQNRTPFTHFTEWRRGLFGSVCDTPPSSNALSRRLRPRAVWQEVCARDVETFLSLVSRSIDLYRSVVGYSLAFR